MPVSGTRPQPLVDTVRVAVLQEVKGYEALNVLHLLLTTDGTRTVDDLASVMSAMASAWNGNFTGIQSSDSVCISLMGTWTTGLHTELVYTQPGPGGGGGSTIGDDLALCAVINWAIGASYRGGHPRTYLPGIPDNGVENSRNLTAGFRANLATAAAAFKNAVDAITAGHISGVQLGCVAMQRENAWLLTPVFEPYQSASVRNVIGTQRRRLHA